MSKITITILGTAAGVPTAERGHSSVYLSYDDGCERCLLFDCGENTQRQLIKAHLNMMKIEGIFITHWHGDHCLGLPGIVDTMGFEGRDRRLDIYAPERARIARSLGFSHSMTRFAIKAHNVPPKGSKVSTLSETERFSIVSMPAKHSVPCVSYALVEKDKRSIDTEKIKKLGLPEQDKRYQELKYKGTTIIDGRKIQFEDVSSLQKGKKIVYSGDTEICDNLRNLAKEADLLIQDCTYFDEMGPDRPYKHASFLEIVEMVREIKIKRTVLTHISRRYEDIVSLRELVKKEPNLEIAEDFMQIIV